MSLHVSIPSTPELVTSEGPSSTQPTNTLVIAALPDPYLEPEVLDALHIHFAGYGQIYKWAPVRGLARVVLVYYLEEDAERAKESCDNLVVGPYPSGLPQFTMRVYRHDHTPLSPTDGEEGNHYLKPPPIEKNFLISPPGSPPEGWEQIREDPPNPTPLAHDLMSALQKLHLQQGGSHQPDESGVSVLVRPEEGEAGITIYVEDCDGDTSNTLEEKDWAYGESSPSRPRFKPVPTSMPSMRVGA
ncbi:carbohydrate-binding module 1 protein [Steccherinum ochraceum]|uniref:Carbohydrate-binding module 1 protein n=1 Tax=Steccherinum ochraceum TaxID=92696 RepID=A0A4R0RJM1_9APHY|nr:carbohydrate-binding module 1 protein [Steccherinum ochraceum]